MTGAAVIVRITAISTRELERRLERRGRLELWNVLTDETFGGEMIPGSRRVPLDRIGQEASATKLAKDSEIIVYCGGSTCSQSRLAAQKLLNLGYGNVRAYEGGLEEWKETGHAVEVVR